MQSAAPLEDFIAQLPKAELHMHIEGSLEPELMLELAARNRVRLRHATVEALRQAHQFEDLQAFLDLYYEGARVLATDRDFHDLTAAYFRRAAEANVRHAEIFCDPQTHTARGVTFGTVVDGITAAMREAERLHDISSKLILCFLRDQPASSAMATLEQALDFRDRIAAVGLGSGTSCGSSTRPWPPRRLCPPILSPPSPEER